jgi:hypothetical protein
MWVGRIDPGPTPDDIGGCDHNCTGNGRKKLAQVAANFSSASNRASCHSTHVASDGRIALTTTVDAVATNGARVE